MLERPSKDIPDLGFSTPQSIDTKIRLSPVTCEVSTVPSVVQQVISDRVCV